MYIYSTRVGKFSIILRAERWHVMFEDDSLGSYATPQQAAEDISGGHTVWPSSGIDPEELDIPADISEWERIK